MPLAHHRDVTHRAGIGFVAVLRELYERLTGSALPVEPVDDTYLSPRRDGLVISRAPRGFTVGMGETVTYRLHVADDVSVTVEDWWEDNISDPETAVFSVHAFTAARLEEAVALLDAAVRRPPPPAQPSMVVAQPAYEDCPSCGGTGVDRWFDGACYGCGGEGKSPLKLRSG